MPSAGTPLDAAAEWDDLTDDERRQAIRRHHLHIEIGPTRPCFRNRPDPERVTITP